MKTIAQRIRFKFIWISLAIPFLLIPLLCFSDSLFLSFFDDDEKDLLNRWGNIKRK